MSASVKSSDINNVHEEVFNYNDWVITSRRSHILQSKCVSPFVCDKTRADAQQTQQQIDLNNICLFCRYEHILSMPHMPDMTYANNSLRIEHKSGFGLDFNCLDALKVVKRELPSHIKVAASENWLKARTDCEFSKILKKPFDWTFTSDYKGSIITNTENITFDICDTNQRIDIEKLKAKEDILFYDDVHLFEDELADHGVVQCSVKIRVMKSSFYVLLRYFLRIDNMLVRLNDTRFYYEVGSNQILREYSTKESDISQTDIPSHILIDPVQLSVRLPSTLLQCHKLNIPVI